MHQDKAFAEFVQQVISEQQAQLLLQLIHAQSENTALQVHLLKQVELQELIILIRKRLQHLIV